MVFPILLKKRVVSKLLQGKNWLTLNQSARKFDLTSGLFSEGRTFGINNRYPEWIDR